MNNYDLLKYTLDSKNGEIRLRFPCPKCGLTEKHILNTKIKSINENSLEMSSVCPNHGQYKTKIEMIGGFTNTTPIINNGSIKNITGTNVTYVMPRI